MTKEEKRINELLEFYQNDPDGVFGALLNLFGVEEAVDFAIKANGRPLGIKYLKDAIDGIDEVYAINEDGTKEILWKNDDEEYE